MLMEISYRDVDKTTELDTLIRTKADKLKRFCDDIVSCRVAVERRQKQRLGNPHRVRIEVTIPPNKDLVVSREPGDTDAHEPLPAMVRDAFKAMERQVKDASSKRRGEVKAHDEPVALVARLHAGEYGFLITNEGREIYFHRNALAQGDSFDDLAVGTEVRYVESMGDDGPQASTVRVVNSVGLRDAAESVGETGGPSGRVIRTRGRPSRTRR